MQSKPVGRYPLSLLSFKQTFVCILQKSFSPQYYPLDSQSFHGQPCRSRSASTTSSLSSCAPGPRLPVEQKNQASNIRADEAVNRVAETIFKLRKDDEGPLYVLQNKQFQDFQEEKNRGLLFIPREEEELQRGDFDVIIIHRIHGYIHIEVKVNITLLSLFV